MLVYMEEEFGFRHWCWDYPGTGDGLKADWAAGRIPPNLGYVGTAEGFLGTVKEIDTPLAHLCCEDDDVFAMSDEQVAEEWRKAMDKYGAYIHVHEDQDSYLMVGGECLSWSRKSDPDALVAARLTNPLPKEQP
jgi:hypothetical protein